MAVCYVGHALWKNESMHTVNQAQRRILDIESCLRTCAQMANVYVFGYFDSCRVNVGSDRTVSNVKSGHNTNLLTVYREGPSKQVPCSCAKVSTLPNLVDHLKEYR